MINNNYLYLQLDTWLQTQKTPKMLRVQDGPSFKKCEVQMTMIVNSLKNKRIFACFVFKVCMRLRKPMHSVKKIPKALFQTSDFYFIFYRKHNNNKYISTTKAVCTWQACANII